MSARGQRAHHFALIESVEQTDVNAARLEKVDLFQWRLAHPQDDVGRVERPLAVISDFRACFLIKIV